MRVPESRGLTARRQHDASASRAREPTNEFVIPGRQRRAWMAAAPYGFASAACSTALQAAGICASVIGGFGFGGSGGGLGCSTASENQ